MTRRRILTVAALAVTTIAAAGVVDWPTKLTWNETASAPIGFYTVEPASRIEVSDLVAVMPPEPLASFMVERGYIGRDVPLLKHVLGLPGQRVCRIAHTITVDGIVMATRWNATEWAAICPSGRAVRTGCAAPPRPSHHPRAGLRL